MALFAWPHAFAVVGCALAIAWLLRGMLGR